MLHHFICPNGSTANRGQCVTKDRASARPAFIGGAERRAWGSRWGGQGGGIFGGVIVK